MFHKKTGHQLCQHLKVHGIVSISDRNRLFQRSFVGNKKLQNSMSESKGEIQQTIMKILTKGQTS